MATTQALYDGKRIIPFLRLEYSRSFNRLPNGEIVGQVYNVNFISTITADKGSPTSSGTFWTSNDYPPDETISSDSRLASILTKQQALRELFSKDNIGKKFEVIPEDESTSLHFFPNSIDISFSEGLWFNTSDFNVAMTCDRIYPDIDGIDTNIESADESWVIQPQENSLGFDVPFTYQVSHSLSAQGSLSYSSGVSNNPFEEAKDWISARTGISNTLWSSFNNVSGLDAYNHVITENINEVAGSYSITETWLFSSGNAIEDYNVSSQLSDDGLTRVTIDGNIRGLESRSLDNITEYKWDNASGYFASIQNNLLTRAQDVSDINLNPIVVSNDIGRNPLAGTITYSYQYDNRPTTLISGARSERIVVGTNTEGESIAVVPVIGRKNPIRGPILQDLGTGPEKTKNLTIDFILGPPSSSVNFNFPNNLVSDLVDQLDPINNGANKSFKQQPQESWEPLTGTGSYNVTWIWE